MRYNLIQYVFYEIISCVVLLLKMYAVIGRLVQMHGLQHVVGVVRHRRMCARASGMIKRVMGLSFGVKLTEAGQHNSYRDDFV
ncbi:hypothetical protein OAN307_c30620 [Octadecabacter antarcticus 307]|uniref:Uncharacterized protein n=1 Tax=Octadecabacter antarcticus 307 TaxID=391626 RepID=M9R7H8_9RHOB|nr:hypothetical protein OAN307_c30620 [Octadecabacter antarcticus 307]